jgi:hypothetical protein
MCRSNTARVRVKAAEKKRVKGKKNEKHTPPINK